MRKGLFGMAEGGGIYQLLAYFLVAQDFNRFAIDLKAQKICFMKQLSQLGKALCLAFLLLFLSSEIKGQLIRPEFTIGLTNYSYFNEGMLGSSLETNTFWNSIVTAPSIGLRIELPKYHFGIESNYYQADVTSSNYIEAFGWEKLYGKEYLDLGVYGFYKGIRASAFYSFSNFRNYHNGPTIGQVDNPAFERAIGIGLEYRLKDYELGFRVERAWEISTVRGFYDLTFWLDAWTFRLNRRFDILELSKNKEPKNPSLNFINLQFGLIGSGNGLHGLVNSMSPFKLAPALGVEFIYDRFEIYLRRSRWVNLDIYREDIGKYSSVNNQIGLAVNFAIRDYKNFKAGIHHVWNYTRGQQHLNILEGQIFDLNQPETHISYIPQNLGWGLSFGYKINPSLDFVVFSDFYYKAAQRLGTGFNAESLRFGLMYNLR